MKIIGFAAQMQNGKDTAADYLYSKLDGWKRSSFAYSLKKLFSDTFQVDTDFINEWKVKSEIPPGFDMTVRKALQFIGDGFRQIKSDIWIELAFRNPEDNVVLSDVRYVNEMKKIKQLGGIIVLLHRDGFENDDPNGSEAQLKPALNFFKNLHGGEFEGSTEEIFAHLSPGDYAALPPGVAEVDMFLRNNGSIEELQTKIDNLLTPYIKGHYDN